MFILRYIKVEKYCIIYYFQFVKIKYFNDKFKGYFLRTSLSSKISKTNSKTVTIKCVTETGEDKNVSTYCHITLSC